MQKDGMSTAKTSAMTSRIAQNSNPVETNRTIFPINRKKNFSKASITRRKSPTTPSVTAPHPKHKSAMDNDTADDKPLTAPVPEISTVKLDDSIAPEYLQTFELKIHHVENRTNNAGLLVCTGHVNNKPATFLIDSGAYPSFIRADHASIDSPDAVTSQTFQIKLADKSTVTGKRT